MAKQDRTKVIIRCKLCGERYTLRGRRGTQGLVETGFKQCLCDNDQDFEVEEQP
ncbi:hypothetical protein LOK74_10085 [Brevibacillus humidisoli]|uniref:hypothetical protein n=1 Tax=Brevibacillus humidisoli TaxID=2895522 RepID=UPI001E56FDAF|nr:hypothetical protein [Brevibacillus humidisoli]UFJ42810.1 hypothetical protein LOK74_10085 [Brevibacillus humidisoli]